MFKLAKDKCHAWLNANADSVIENLNRNFAKPWFAQKKDGTVVKDLGDLTYEETDLPLVRLMYVNHQSRWIDISLRNLLGDWLRRGEERFAGVHGKPKQSILHSYNSLNDPEPFVITFLGTYPEAREQLLAAEDKKYFLSIARCPGQKPAPFIPVLDASFEMWFKKVRNQIYSSNHYVLMFPIRILFGLRKILAPCLIRILSTLLFYRVL